MKPRSCKSKGRVLQNLVRDLILKTFPFLHPDDCRSCSMGSQGEDIQLSPAARAVFPYSTECKNTEKLNLFAAWNQAVTNTSDDAEPLLVVKKNRTEALAVVRLDHFMKLVGPQEDTNDTQ